MKRKLKVRNLKGLFEVWLGNEKVFHLWWGGRVSLAVFPCHKFGFRISEGSLFGTRGFKGWMHGVNN